MCFCYASSFFWNELMLTINLFEMRILAVWSCKQCILQFSVLCLGSTYYIWCKLDIIKLSSSMLSNVISFVSWVESKSLLEIFICDKVFCCSFTVVRVVFLIFFWLLYVTAWRLKIEYVITMSTVINSYIVMLKNLSPLSVATYSRSLGEFIVF